MTRRYALLLALMLAAVVLPLRAQTGCADSPEIQPLCWLSWVAQARSWRARGRRAAASVNLNHRHCSRMDGEYDVNRPRIFLSLSISASLVALASAALAGCGGHVTTGGGGGGGGGGCTPSVGSSTPASCPSRTPVAGVSFSGKVMSATKPVVGASVQL